MNVEVKKKEVCRNTEKSDEDTRKLLLLLLMIYFILAYNK